MFGYLFFNQEIGPRLSLKLLKIEDGLGKGETIFHSLKNKTDDEKELLRKKFFDKEQKKMKNKEIQDTNVQRKVDEKAEKIRVKNAKYEEKTEVQLEDAEDEIEDKSEFDGAEGEFEDFDEFTETKVVAKKGEVAKKGGFKKVKR